MASGAANAAPPVASNICVSTAGNGGWIVTVELNGQSLVTEHHTDWHRVERRIEALRSTMASLFARIPEDLEVQDLSYDPWGGERAPDAGGCGQGLSGPYINRLQAKIRQGMTLEAGDGGPAS